MALPPLLIIAGPTAVGKTELSVGLAYALNGQIISADSMQVYRHMDIGTAKITREEMQGIPHYLIDECEPTQEFNVFCYKERCKEYIEQITAQKKLPILVGGTGFYIRAVLYDTAFSPAKADLAYREKLSAYAKENGNDALWKKLCALDPEAAKAIHQNNVKRVIRALEYQKQTGEKISAHNQREKENSAKFRFKYYVLSLPREILYEQINLRTDQMIREGLEDEVRALLALGCTRDSVSMQGIGYRQMIDYVQGRDTLENVTERIKKETRHYAKRQYTWFGRQKDVTWLNLEEFADKEELLAYCIRDCQSFF